MPRITLLPIVVLLCWVASACAQNRSGGDTNLEPIQGCNVIARIDGQPVLASEVLWRVNIMIEDNKDRIPPDKVEEVRQMLMRNNLAGLVDMKLLFADFKRTTAGKADMKSIEKQLQGPFEEKEVPRLMETLKVDDVESLERELIRLGTSLAERRTAFIEQAIAGEWVQQSAGQEKATHAELIARYQQDLEKYEYAEQVKWEELHVSFAKHNSKQQAKNALANLGNQVWQAYSTNREATKPLFAEVAKQKSDGFTASEGGYHDWTTKGALRETAVDNALFSLPVGTMSPIIEGINGYYIVRVLERKEAGRTPFQEVQNDLRKQIEQERRMAKIESTIAKLRQKGRVWTIFTGDTTAQAYLKAAEQTMMR